MEKHKPYTGSLFAPRTREELEQRVRSLAGRTVADVSTEHGLVVPETLLRAKGFLGDLTEAALGAPRSNRSAPDFTELGIELKTLPLKENGTPAESTYVCRVKPDLLSAGDWSTSRVRSKLETVLFIPMSTSEVIGHRVYGAGFFWSVLDDEEQIRADWEDFSEWAARGALSELTARRGTILQVRPKARNASKKQLLLDSEGEEYLSSPRGFYLRPNFTKRLVSRVFGE